MIINWPFLLTLISAASCQSISPCQGQYPCLENDWKPGMVIEARDTNEKRLAAPRAPEPSRPLKVYEPQSSPPEQSAESENCLKSTNGGYHRVRTSRGFGWNVRFELGLSPGVRSASSLDWADRWKRVTKCLSFPEPDNFDMFEMDELALEAFWDRVWECYLLYALGTR